MATKKKILVISENLILVRFLEQLEGDDEYEVASARETDISAIKSLLQKVHADFLILDIMMPSLDGIKTCLKIRPFSDVPIVMLTAWGAGQGKVRGIDLASDGYLTKPFGINELKMRLIDACRRNSAAAG